MAVRLQLTVLITVLFLGSTVVSADEPPTRVWGSSPPAALMVYAFDPGLLVGSIYPLAGPPRPMVDPRMAELPRIGGWFGQGRIPNLETLMEAEPDLVVVWDNLLFRDQFEDALGKLDYPALYLDLGQTEAMPNALRQLGERLGQTERGEQLASYADQVLESVREVRESLPEQERPSVYYAEGPKGLQTDCDQSFHAELIPLAGGRNVYQCEQRQHVGRETVGMEQVLAWDPDVILVFDHGFYERIGDDPRWRVLRAVKNGNVHFIPRAPFSWFDRPPSFMRLVGLPWLAQLLHPDRYIWDAETEVPQFYSLFLRESLTATGLRAIMDGTELAPGPSVTR
ncbi:MAG TPA: ABC transporter substrate-binding protein [Guyparkeria sp.]|nr:ABC transporter substrate-binding protein [Guyparkeria sp.]